MFQDTVQRYPHRPFVTTIDPYLFGWRALHSKMTVILKSFFWFNLIYWKGCTNLFVENYPQGHYIFLYMLNLLLEYMLIMFWVWEWSGHINRSQSVNSYQPINISDKHYFLQSPFNYKSLESLLPLIFHLSFPLS